MGHHYEGVDPDEAGISKFEFRTDEFNVPGQEHSYNIDTIVDIADVVDNQGSLIPGEVVDAATTVLDFIQSQEGDVMVIETFLGYAESDWSLNEMWENTDYNFSEIDMATDRLEQEEVLEVNYGDVTLTDGGIEVYDAFEVLSESDVYTVI